MRQRLGAEVPHEEHTLDDSRKDSVKRMEFFEVCGDAADFCF